MVKNIRHTIKTWLDGNPVTTDILMAAALCILVLLNLWVDLGTSSLFRLLAAISLILLTTLPLAVMRRFPIAVLFIIAASLIVFRLLQFPESPFTEYCLLLAFASAGIYGSQKWRNRARFLSGLATILSLIYIVFFAERIWILPIQAIMYKLSILLFELFLFIAAWWIGEVFRIRREHENELELKTELLEKETQENARRAVVEERLRIARELHDVVAHHVSVIGIQAAAARRLMNQQPDKVADLLLHVEESSRQAINELHRLLGFMRGQEDQEEIAPQPTLSKLDLLIKQMNDAGMEVSVSEQGNASIIPPSVDLSAYRIVQEALTNTLKHAFPAKAIVTIKYSDVGLEVTISDNGPGDKSKSLGSSKGKGLIGMRERVALCGGEFSAGNAPEGGFLVKAIFPFGRQK
jgi:signal transduction histidine kinase